MFNHALGCRARLTSDLNHSLDTSIVDANMTDRHNYLPSAPSGARLSRRQSMRASLFVAAGAAFGLLMTQALTSAPAHADPAYKARTVADFFVDQLGGRSKSICFGTAADCPAPSFTIRVCRSAARPASSPISPPRVSTPAR
jgi:hypothetical protein